MSYEITVKTACSSEAGHETSRDGMIYFNLYGDTGLKQDVAFSSGDHRDKWVHCRTDKFLYTEDELNNLGRPYAMELYLDPHGDRDDSWAVEYVEIRYNGNTFRFDFRTWLTFREKGIGKGSWHIPEKRPFYGVIESNITPSTSKITKVIKTKWYVFDNRNSDLDFPIKTNTEVSVSRTDFWEHIVNHTHSTSAKFTISSGKIWTPKASAEFKYQFTWSSTTTNSSTDVFSQNIKEEINIIVPKRTLYLWYVNVLADSVVTELYDHDKRFGADFYNFPSELSGQTAAKPYSFSATDALDAKTQEIVDGATRIISTPIN